MKSRAEFALFLSSINTHIGLVLKVRKIRDSFP